MSINLDHYKPFPQTVTGNDGDVIGHVYKFTNLDELQTAMSSLSELANGQKAVPQWLFIPTGTLDKGDPLGQNGYLALKIAANKGVDTLGSQG